MSNLYKKPLSLIGDFASLSDLKNMVDTIRCFVNTYQWANEENMDVVYFCSVDETRKITDETDVVAYWDLWDKDGKPKYV